jgi:hypothetical protein
MSDDADLAELEDLEVKIPVPANAREKVAGYAFANGVAKRLTGRLKQGLGEFPGLSVKCDEVENSEDEFETSVIARQGLRVGAEVDLEWEVGDTELSVETSTFSLLQTIMGVGLTVLLGCAGVVGVIADIPPFDQIPGRRFGLLIGFIAGAIPGFILFLILNPILMAGAGPDNEKLLKAINELVKTELAAIEAEQSGDSKPAEAE